MRVSCNELSTLCARAAQGGGCADGVGDELAEIATWLACCDPATLGAIHDGLVHASSRAGPSPATYDYDPDSTILDAAGDSALQCGSMAADLLCSRAYRDGHATLVVRRCHQRVLMVGHAMRIAARGFHALVDWRYDSAPPKQRQALAVSSGHGVAELWTAEGPARENPTGADGLTVTLCAARGEPGLARIMDRWSGFSETQTIDGPTLLARRDEAWNIGIELPDDLWRKMRELSAAMLVEESEESRRRGAGEQAP